MSRTPKWHRLARDMYRQGYRVHDIAADTGRSGQDIQAALRFVRRLEPRDTLYRGGTPRFEKPEDVFSHMNRVTHSELVYWSNDNES